MVEVGVTVVMREYEELSVERYSLYEVEVATTDQERSMRLELMEVAERFVGILGFAYVVTEISEEEAEATPARFETMT